MLAILMFAAALAAEPAPPILSEPPPPLPVPPAPYATKPGAPYGPPAPTAPMSPTFNGVARPDWVRMPNGEDIARFYPDRALRLEREGNATIQCAVEADGRLSGCEIVSESPADFGFGEAALKISRLFKLRPQTLDGQPVAGGTVRIPLAFRLPDAGPPLDLVTPLTFDEAVMCHTVFARQARYRRLAEARRWQAIARALAVQLGAERGYSGRTVGKWLKQAMKTGVYDDDRRCQLISGIPVQPALSQP